MQLGKFPSQGTSMGFACQGAAGEFSIVIVKREYFVTAVWVVILAAGVVLLKFSGFTRAVISLAAITGVAVAYLFAPLLAENTAEHGGFAFGIVLILWFIHWVFFGVLRKRKSCVPPPLIPTAEVEEIEEVIDDVEPGDDEPDTGAGEDN